MKAIFIHFRKFPLYFLILILLSCKNQSGSNQGTNNKNIDEVSEISEPEPPVVEKDGLKIDQPSSQQSDSSGQISLHTHEAKNEAKAIPGPKSFITKDKTKLLEEPNIKSDLVETLKNGDVIYILGTGPFDENGYPTWYKVQTTKNKTGWVVASSVSSGH